MYNSLSHINATAVDANAGNVSGGTQRVTLATDDINAAKITAAVEIMDDWDETNRAAVNTIAGQVGIAANAGAMDALTTRVTIATDDTHFGAVGSGGDSDGALHAQLTYIADGLDIIGQDIYKVAATGSGAITATSAAAAVWELDHVSIHFDIAPAASEDLVISIDATDGAAYDTVLLRVDPSTGSLGDITYIPNKPLTLASGDEITVSFTNTDGRTYGVRIIGRKLGI